MKILIIEDEKELRKSLSDFIEGEGFIAENCATYDEAVDKVSAHNYDLLILDIGLGVHNGLDLLRSMKARLKDTGVIILSARDSFDDKIDGLDLGADDYITKPFHFGELKARIRSVHRRRNLGGNTAIEIGNLILHPDKFEATINETLLNLTKKEFSMLLFFVTNRNRVLTKVEIVEHLWGDYADSFDNFDFIYTHIKNLRKKLEQAGCKIGIRTVHRLGYKLNHSETNS